MEEDSSLVLGLVADPDFPELAARRLAERLPQRLGGERQWRVEVEVDPVTAGRQNSGEMLRTLRQRREQRGWDVAICVTDLPLRLDGRPVLAEANISHQVGLISLPALGALQPRRRARQVVAQLLEEFGQVPTQDQQQRRRRYGLLSPLTQLLGPIQRQNAGSEDERDVRYRATRMRGRLRLLSGMVRTNRPWRLVFGMSSALAAAVATSAFGLSSSTIWQLGDRLSLPRQILAVAASIALLVFWLITAHGLWERRQKGSARDREQRTLYNTSTVATLAIGVSCLYGGLFVINVAVAAFLLTPGLLASTLEHPVGWGSYFTLAWGFTTMGVVAGALGSSLESDAAVRQAAYGYREEQRRRHHEATQETNA